MEWLTAVRGAIDYMENNLMTVTGAAEVAKSVCLSEMYLQRGFSVLTGYTLGEYIRNRRLYLAALDIANTDAKVIDIAFKYGYETPESFTKAFTRFHSASPSDLRKGKGSIRSFLPLRIKLTIQGGDHMEFKIEKKESFTVIGFDRVFRSETAYAEVPKFWDEIMDKFAAIFGGKAPETAQERACIENCVGEFGVCVGDAGMGAFRYIIAGRYKGGEVPEGMVTYKFPEYDWAVFDCRGSMPDSLQSLNTRIFSEWLPGNREFELTGNASIEWYDEGDPAAPDYHSAIWLPIMRK